MENSAHLEELAQLKSRMAAERPAPWEDLPDIPLYMDQVVSYLGRQLITFHPGEGMTAAMINNYIKDGIVPRARGKRYEQEHLAALTEVAALKQVLSVRDLATLLEHWAGRDHPEERYARFCAELDAALAGALAGMEENGGEPAELAMALALRAYADVLACRRILDLLREHPPDGAKNPKKEKKK